MGPLVWRGAWLPCLCDAAAFLSEYVAVVPKLGLECQLMSWIVCGLVNPIAPNDKRAQCLDVSCVFPPSVFQVGQGPCAASCTKPKVSAWQL